MDERNKLAQLKSLGYEAFFEDSRLELGFRIDCLARVMAEHRGAYEIINKNGEYRATVPGKFMQDTSCREGYPAVGDWVAIRDNDEDVKTIEAILPRQTVLRRKYSGKDESQLIAANVGVAFIVGSMDHDYNVNRFERYIVLSKDGGVRPVIVLNKSDLIDDEELSERVERLRQRFFGVDILCTSTQTSDGLADLVNYIQKGVTYCFLGSSGVGKSTLINKLLNQDLIKTKEMGAKTKKGRHTTTARQMYLMSNGGIIIDNPGSREVGVVDFDAGAKEVFVDIAELARHCKFKDCKHVNEKGCVVLDAVNSGHIDSAQYENYVKLQKENEHYGMSDYEKRQKGKKFGRLLKNAKEELKKHKSR